MTKKADFPALASDQLSELRGVFARFELILRIFHDYQKGMDRIDILQGGVPFVSVLRLFSESWEQNSLLFDSLLPDSGFHFEEILFHLQAAADIFAASEKAVSAGLPDASPGVSSYAFLLQCVCLRCRILLASSRRRLRRLGV